MSEWEEVLGPVRPPRQGIIAWNSEPKCRDENPEDPCEGVVTRQPYQQHQQSYTWLCVKHEKANKEKR